MTPEQKRLQTLQLQNYDYLKLERFAEKSIIKTKLVAEKIYGDKWNYYSNALRREVIHSFQRSIVELQSHFNQISYLEIGSAQGLSMAVIGLMLSELDAVEHLDSIDPYFDSGYVEGAKGIWKQDAKIEINKNTRDQALRLYKAIGLNVDLHEMRSSEGLKELLSENRKFQLIYIDGSHEGLNPVVDLGLSYGLLDSNGVIMLDDHHWPDVAVLKSLCDSHWEKVDESWKVAAYKIPNQKLSEAAVRNGEIKLLQNANRFGEDEISGQLKKLQKRVEPHDKDCFIAIICPNCKENLSVTHKGNWVCPCCKANLIVNP